VSGQLALATSEQVVPAACGRRCRWSAGGPRALALYDARAMKAGTTADQANGARYLVVAPQTSGNSLGRALSLIDMLERLGPSRLVAFDTGPIWPGAQGTGHDVASFTSFEALSSMVRAEADRADGRLVVVAVKPFPRTLGWAAQLRQQLSDRLRLVADIDDADVSIQSESRRGQRPRERVRRFTTEVRDPEVHTPARIRRTLRRSLRRADGLFVSSWALRAQVRSFSGPTFRVPHPRRRHPYVEVVSGDRLGLGFLGTPLKHKGLDRLFAILAARPETELHLLDGTPIPSDVEDAVRKRLVMHPLIGADTLERAFRSIDVVVLPQNASTDGGRLQLPAKLIDAHRFGRPVVATATPPILEFGGPALQPVRGWSDLQHGLRALDELSCADKRERLGRAANLWFNNVMSSEAQAEALEAPLAEALWTSGRIGYVA